MKTRIVIGMALLMLISATALAADNSKSTITINGGVSTVFMGPYSRQAAAPACTKGKFYDNICGGSINSGTGWTISDGSPIGTEYTPASQIIALKSGTTKKLAVEVGFVTGTNGAIVILDKDCKNAPCGKIDKTNLCKGNITNLFNFGSAPVPEPIKCKAKLVKGKAYWVYAQSLANSWLAWDLSAAYGGQIEYTNDAPGAYQGSAQVGGLAIY